MSIIVFMNWRVNIRGIERPCLALNAQEPTPVDSPVAGQFLVPPGTKVPLSMINSVSTKTASEGERIYLETVFPILANGKIVIPPGSYVAGTVTDVKRPGRMKGRGELYIRFDSLTLPNGVTRDFRARIGSLDGRAAETLDKEEGRIKSEGNKVRRRESDRRSCRSWRNSRRFGRRRSWTCRNGCGHRRRGRGHRWPDRRVGLTRGPEAILAKGTTMDMVLDRPLSVHVRLKSTSLTPWAGLVRVMARVLS